MSELNLRGSCYGSYYQKGKTWAAKRLKWISDMDRECMIDLFEYYHSPQSKETNQGVPLTPSKKQFYYGASKYLRDHRKVEQVNLFKQCCLISNLK